MQTSAGSKSGGMLTREFWEELVGTKACGGYLLRRLIGSTEESAVYQTAYGEESAALKLTVAGDSAPDVPQLEHRCIAQVYASGRCDLGGSQFRFFVTELADENLATVVAVRGLSAAETQEMLGPVLEGLAYLHDRGLAHGRIKPSNILAKGDSVKLSADSVRPAGAVVSPEEDMRALGLTIIEVLTQERQPSGIAAVPQPLRDIVEHALQPDSGMHWTARQAQLRLSGKLPEKAPPPQEDAGAMPFVQATRKPIPVWLYPAAGAVMLLAVIYVLARGTGSPSDSSLAASAPAQTQAPAPVKTPVREPTLPPQPTLRSKPTPFEAPVKAPAALAVQPAAKAAAMPSGHGWFVVVASYTREVDAAQMARTLGRRFPDFKPSVFPPSLIDTHYLVIIGSGLSQERAESMRQRAVASGLPGDTYIKRYPSGSK